MQSQDTRCANGTKYSPRTSPTRNYREKITYLKFLISNAEAGIVIGKGGYTVSGFQSQSETLIELSRNYEFFPGTSDRIIMVSGPVNCVIKAVELILEKFLNETYGEEVEDEPSSKVRLVVPHSCCGGIIGRGGSTIKSFVELSQASIKVSSQNDLYVGLSDRLVTVVGTISEQMQAIDLILPKLSENPYYTQSLNVPLSYAGYNIVHYKGVSAKMFSNIYQNKNRHTKGPGVLQEGKGNSVTIGIADEHIGHVLGRGGRNLRDISQISGARINISNRDDFISGTTDRKVTITGTPRAIRVAEDMIMHIVDSVVKQQ